MAVRRIQWSLMQAQSQWPVDTMFHRNTQRDFIGTHRRSGRGRHTVQRSRWAGAQVIGHSKQSAASQDECVGSAATLPSHTLQRHTPPHLSHTLSVCCAVQTSACRRLLSQIFAVPSVLQVASFFPVPGLHATLQTPSLWPCVSRWGWEGSVKYAGGQFVGSRRQGCFTRRSKRHRCGCVWAGLAGVGGQGT